MTETEPMVQRVLDAGGIVHALRVALSRDLGYFEVGQDVMAKVDDVALEQQADNLFDRARPGR